jgi:hypothetical protein
MYVYCDPFCSADDLAVDWHESLKRAIGPLSVLLLIFLQGKRAELEQAVAQAQRKKLGQWSLSESERVSAAEQKRLLKQAAVTGTAPVPVSRNDRSSGAMPLASTSRNGQTGVGESLLDAAVTGLEFM